MGSFSFANRFRVALSRVQGDGGFTLVESLMAAVLLMTVGTALSGVLASSVVTYGAAREKTLAQQLAMDEVEAIRRMPFSSVGLPNGNPACTPCPPMMVASRTIDVVGLHAKMNLEVSYVDDQTPNAYRTYANYKKIAATVVRVKDSKVLTREVTYLSAAARNSATESVINATVVDLGNNTPVVGATVNLATGPSAPRADATDASGKAIFPALTANPASGSQAYYDLNVVTPYGYAALEDDLSPSTAAHSQLGVAQTWEPFIRLFKPCSLNVSIPSPPANGLPATVVPYTLSVGSRRSSQQFAQSAGTAYIPVTSVAGKPLVPLPSSAGSSQYTVGASAVYGSGSGAKYYFATGVSKNVPIKYPTDLTQSFTLVFGATPYTATQVSALTIRVETAGGSLIGGAQVNISGGPGAAPGIYVTATTATSGGSKGLATVYVPSGAGYTLTAWGPATSAQLTSQSITSTTTRTIAVP